MHKIPHNMKKQATNILLRTATWKANPSPRGKVRKTKVGSFDTIYSELHHYFPVDELQDEQVPNTAALYQNKARVILPQEYVWWDLMSVMVHATSLCVRHVSCGM